jgi:hypothetical protein
VREDLLGHRLLKDRDDDLRFSATFRAVLEVERKNAFDRHGPVHQLS